MAKIEEQVNARTLRERALLLISVVMLIFILWRNLVFNYLSASTDQLIANKERLATQIHALQGQIENLSEAIKNDSTVTLERKLKEAVAKNISLKDKINQHILSIENSGNMITVLKSLVSQEDNIKLERIESLEDKPVFSEKSEIYLYNKGIKLEIEGEYLATINFLEKLEKSDIKILWDSLTYEVTRYPLAKVSIEIHTMGTQKGWLHV
jgi:MSHA biogenesis protein MshJ